MTLSSVGITISYPVVYTEMVLTSLSRQWKVHLQELIGSSLLNKVGPTPYTTHFTTPSTHRPRAISTSLALQCKTALRTQSLPQPPLPHKPFAPFGYNFKHYDTIHLMTSGSSNAVGGKNPWRGCGFATAWRVSRLLGGSRIDPKKRSMAAPAPTTLRPGPQALECTDGELQCCIGSGALPGDSIAGAGYHNKVDTCLGNTSSLAIPATRPTAIQPGNPQPA